MDQNLMDQNTMVLKSWCLLSLRRKVKIVEGVKKVEVARVDMKIRIRTNFAKFVFDMRLIVPSKYNIISVERRVILWG